VQERLLAEIDDRLRAPEDGRVRALVAAVKHERDGLAAALERLAAHPAEALLHARHLTDYISDIFTTALLLSAAEMGLQEGDGHAYLIARHYLRQELDRPPRRGITDGDDSVTRHFADLIAYRPIAPAELKTSCLLISDSCLPSCFSAPCVVDMRVENLIVPGLFLFIPEHPEQAEITDPA
jgi:hypothetical protein